MDDYTLVIAVDHDHLRQLALTWPTWMLHKPELGRVPMVVIYDYQYVSPTDISRVIQREATYVPWPIPEAEYPPGDGKWDNPQRYKMLAAFVHVPGRVVETRYWLKLDVDTVAVGCRDWIDPAWFKDDPVIVSQGWHYTKPADQMQRLDRWVVGNADKLVAWANYPPLNLVPQDGATLVKHKRIISWCAFFDTEFTAVCSDACTRTCGSGMLPVPSQDGVLWYLAQRAELPWRRVDMKSMGWEHWTTEGNIRKAAEASQRMVRL